MRERTDELLVSDIQGHVPERRGHCTHYTVIVYSEELHKDGQAFLFPDSGSDIDRPLPKEGRQRRLETEVRSPIKPTALRVARRLFCSQEPKRLTCHDLAAEQAE